MRASYLREAFSLDNHKGKCLNGEFKLAKRITETMTEEENKGRQPNTKEITTE